MVTPIMKSRAKLLLTNTYLKVESCFNFFNMSMLTAEIREFVNQQKLGFVATVCPDGTPNLSPKGTTTAWDEEHLVFADIHSPGTVENLLTNSSVEINIVDVFSRKGYRFKGKGTVISEGAIFDEVVKSYRERAATYTIKNIVLVKIERVLPITSPVYDTGISEEDVVGKWSAYWNLVHAIR
jgi:uncharacterized protein